MPAGPNTELKLQARLSSISSFGQPKDRVPGVQVRIQNSVKEDYLQYDAGGKSIYNEVRIILAYLHDCP